MKVTMKLLFEDAADLTSGRLDKRMSDLIPRVEKSRCPPFKDPMSNELEWRGGGKRSQIEGLEDETCAIQAATWKARTACQRGNPATGAPAATS